MESKMELKFQIQKTALLDRFKYELKDIPIVEGVVLENKIYKDIVINNLFLILNREPSYIKKITGIDYYKNTNSLRHKIEILYSEKEELEAKKEIISKINETSQLLYQVTEYETEIYDKKITDLDKKVKEIMKKINELGLKINISTSSTRIYNVVDDNNLKVGYQVIFNRLNKIKICTPEEVMNKRIKVL